MLSDTIIDTPIGEISLIEHGIVYVYYKPIKMDSLEDFHKTEQAISTLMDGKKALLLLDSSRTKGSSKAIRNEAAKDKGLYTAAAVLIDSQFTKFMGNLFMSFSKPEYPTKLFTDRQDAIKWLLSFK